MGRVGYLENKNFMLILKKQACQKYSSKVSPQKVKLNSLTP
jgi:hypothetical protein